MKTNHPMCNQNKFKLGLFCSNLNGGLSANTLPERWHATWDNCLALAEMADAAGIEVLVPASRWIGWGGAGFQEDGMESLIWAAALAHRTTRLSLFSTVHVPMFPPILAAKQMAAVDVLLNGRFGLNLVCGWNQQEAELFGTRLHEHDRQYDQAQEWIDIVRAYWRDEPVDHFEGEFYDLKHIDRAQGPRAYDGDPVMLNAAFSPRGRQFAARNCDFLLTSPSSLDAATGEVAAIKSNAEALGHTTGVIVTAHVICRPTRDEAEAYQRRVLEHADDGAVDNILNLFRIYNPRANEVAAGMDQSSAMSEAQYQAARNAMITGHGSFPIIGSPADVADAFIRMANAGVDGAILGLTNYLEELPLIRDEVMPRLEAVGLRLPSGPSPSPGRRPSEVAPSVGDSRHLGPRTAVGMIPRADGA